MRTKAAVLVTLTALALAPSCSGSTSDPVDSGASDSLLEGERPGERPGEGPGGASATTATTNPAGVTATSAAAGSVQPNPDGARPVLSGAHAGSYAVEGKRGSGAVSEDDFRAALTIGTALSTPTSAVQDVVFADESTGQRTTQSIRWDEAGVAETRVVVHYESSPDPASDCAWQPARLIVPKAARVGTKWTASVICSDKRPSGAVQRSQTDAAEVVREDELAIGGKRHAALVIRRQSMLRVGDSDGHEQAEEWYVPDVGVVLKQKSTFTRAGEVAPAVATSTTEWHAVRRT